MVEVSKTKALNSVGRYGTRTCPDIKTQKDFHQGKLYAMANENYPDGIEMICCKSCADKARMH